jgi:putative flippase GtrA
VTDSEGEPNAGRIATYLWIELVLAGRFGLVGVAATAVHMLVVWLLIEASLLPTLAANLVAFLAAFGVSFAGNYYWTFQSPGSPRRAIRRFFLISSSAFAANTILLAGLLHAGWLPPTAAAITAAAVIPLITYMASRLWGFREPGGHTTGS